MIRQAVHKVIAFLVGDGDTARSAIALCWGFSIALVLKFSLDMVYFIAIHDGEDADINTSIPVLMADLAMLFGAMIVAAYVAAWLAPARAFRHAIVSGLGFYIGAPVGILRNWGVVPAWHYVLVLVVALAGAAMAGGLDHVRRQAARHRGP